jgi:hypothetical protein
MKKTNLFKMAALTAVLVLGSMFASAQIYTESPTDNIPKQQEAQLGQDSGYVKVIDNKGTVKFLQSRNGITMFTNTAPSGGIVTTWQLGGTLSDSTYIDLNGNKFGLKQLTYSTTGRTYEFVVIDSITGEFRKQKLTDLIDAGTFIKVIASGDVTNGAVVGNTFPIVVTGVTLESFKTVYVFRNGAKLMAGVDYTITTPTTESTVTLNIAGSASTDYTAGSAAWESYPLYQGDRIEIQYIK